MSDEKEPATPFLTELTVRLTGRNLDRSQKTRDELVKAAGLIIAAYGLDGELESAVFTSAPDVGDTVTLRAVPRPLESVPGEPMIECRQCRKVGNWAVRQVPAPIPLSDAFCSSACANAWVDDLYKRHPELRDV
jgi:hypothetical protein